MNRLFVGAMTGFIAGLLFAPQTGKKPGSFSKNDSAPSEVRQWEGNT
jgi:gas vesicle protein